jgi:D-aminoacyl-tRNA deacylase
VVDAVPLIGFGGTHYATRETEIALSTRGAFGHIAHTREAGTLDEAMIRSMIEKSGAVAAYIDRKAIDRESLRRLNGILDAIPIIRLSESEIAAIGHLPWETYRAIRDLANQAAPGSRCFIHALEGTGPLEVIAIDPVLLGEAAKADEPGLIRDLNSLPVVHISSQDNRLLPVFVTFTKHSSQIINALNTLCVKIIRSNENTATERDYLIITKIRFDPTKARELGIPEGPACHQLAAGQAVDINGQLITPEMVASGREIRIHVPGLEKFT